MQIHCRSIELAVEMAPQSNKKVEIATAVILESSETAQWVSLLEAWTVMCEDLTWADCYAVMTVRLSVYSRSGSEHVLLYSASVFLESHICISIGRFILYIAIMLRTLFHYPMPSRTVLTRTTCQRKIYHRTAIVRTESQLTVRL